jgi:FtsH-binding integral membrane protein
MNQQDSVSILAAMIKEKENILSKMKQASYFVALTFLAGFVILVFLQAIEVLALISVFTLLIVIMLTAYYFQLKKDVASIEELYFGYEINKRKKE